jgi:hypothetical protein
LAATYMAKHWLHACITNHRGCRRSVRPSTFPSRILDIKRLQSESRVHLVQDASLREPYVALSHRWGVEGLPTTTSNNISDRHSGIDVVELSPTMRDAVNIVQMLGHRYIWIDALCIIQDSTDDWISEASKMSSVFSGAVVTIAVADAEDHSQGIFRERRARCVRPFHIPYLQDRPYRERSQLEGEGEYYVFPKTSLVGAGARAKRALDTRGWM